MVAVIRFSVCIFALIVTLNLVSCEVDRGLKFLVGNNVDKFEIQSDEKSATVEEDGPFTNDGLCATCGRIRATLTVTNGGPWGTWGPMQLCPSGSYAIGYDMKIEPKKRIRDNTALNAIKLICATPRGKVTGEITSTIGHWGSWVGQQKCLIRGHKRRYLTSFDLQVEAKKKGILKDNTAANYVKFTCRDYKGYLRPTVLVKPPGHGYWGTWGKWSAECPVYTAICGIRTKVQKPRGFWHDDTALNDVKFYCCI